jgi:membrane-bound metal-dependent hydrolase YbcI (DUF457 family)
MTGITHQMVALLAALWLVTLYPVSLGPTLGILAIVAVMIGALTPDLDQPTANIWRRLLGGRAVGNIFQWFSGGHRHMTHSLIGIAIIGYMTRWVAVHLISEAYRGPALVIWIAYMVGYISHPIADTLTDRGVPWLWPFKINIKVPPGPEEVRVTTDSFVETLLVRGGIIIAALLLLTKHWPAIRYYFGW